MRHQRRQLLRVAAAGSLGALAGCTFGFGSTSEEVGFGVANNDDSEHRVSTSLAFQGETLVESTVSLAPGESWETAFRNPDTVGDAQLVGSLENGEEESWRVQVGPGTGIHNIGVEVTSDGELLKTGVRS